MATKTISITEEAYERLASKKASSESFSDVIIKITGKGSLMDIAGILTKEESTSLRKHVTERRRAMRESIDKKARRFH